MLRTILFQCLTSSSKGSARVCGLNNQTVKAILFKEGKELYVKELEHLGFVGTIRISKTGSYQERWRLADIQGCGHSHLWCINFLAALLDNSCFWRLDISSHLIFLHIKHFPLWTNRQYLILCDSAFCLIYFFWGEENSNQQSKFSIGSSMPIFISFN